MNGNVVPLTEIKEQEEALVRSIDGGSALISRLAGLGISPGTKLRVVRNRGGRLIVMVANTRVALGRGECEKILTIRAPAEKEEEQKVLAPRQILVGLAGQPNIGKSTLFNLLTGLSQHVGNWPGKTVERKEGIHLSPGYEMRIVDLPGTYSLTAFSDEEKIARDFIIKQHPDIIILLVNASALERSLYLLAELLLLDSPVVLAVNMLDLAENQGIRVDIESLRRSLGIPVVGMVATRNMGVRELVWRIMDLNEGVLPYNPKLPEISPEHAFVFNSILQLTGEFVHQPYTSRWIATKLMEGDPEVFAIMEEEAPPEVMAQVRTLLSRHEDSQHAVVHGRYDWVEKITHASVSTSRKGQVLITDRLDHILTKPFPGIPILLGIMGAIFALTYGVGSPLQQLLERLIMDFGAWAGEHMQALPAWIPGLLVDGIIGGAGSVLSFLPILLIFFAAMSFMEDVGYMARAAFVMDRFMHIVGLHGKSFIPLCLGFGCNVPAIMAARLIESKRAKLLTVFLAPFIPCTARLAVLTFMAAAMFPGKELLVTWGLLTANIIILGITGFVLNRFFLKSETMPFIMELPLYQKPNWQTVATSIWRNIVAFVKRAGTVILGVSIVLWFLANIPGGAIESSVLGRLGRLLEPVGLPLGLDWKMIVALITSLIAKENAIATLGVLNGAGREGLRQVLPSVIEPASALAFLVVLMLFIPCAASIASMRHEMGDRRWFLGSMAFMLLLSYFVGLFVYRLALASGM